MKRYIYFIISLILIGAMVFVLYLTNNNNGNNDVNIPVPPTQKVYDAESWKTEIPSTCKSFFDGCNNCGRDGSRVTCTRLGCDTYQKPQCLDN